MNKVKNKSGKQEHPLDKIRGEVENVFDRLSDNWHEFESTVSEHLPEWMPKFIKPKVDASESNDKLEFAIEMPGLEPEQIDVSIQDGALVIEGHKESESEKKSKNYYLKERSSQKYYRSFTLPDDVEGSKITANSKNGLLTITIPRKAKKKTKVEKIKIVSE